MILSAASVKNSVVLFLIVVSGLSPGLLRFWRSISYFILQRFKHEMNNGWLFINCNPPVIFGNDLEVVPWVLTLLRNEISSTHKIINIFEEKGESGCNITPPAYGPAWSPSLQSLSLRLLWLRRPGFQIFWLLVDYRDQVVISKIYSLLVN